MKIDLNGQVALVTGSSRGIGRMCALYLAEAGCDIVVNYKTDKASGEKTCEEVRAKGRKAHLVQCDVVDSKQVEDLVKSGIAPDRLRTISFGEDKPIALGHDATAKAEGELPVLQPVRPAYRLRQTLRGGEILSLLQKSKGAVSPEIRATASNTPVTTPARAARSVMLVITFHLGVPSA